MGAPKELLALHGAFTCAGACRLMRRKAQIENGGNGDNMFIRILASIVLIACSTHVFAQTSMALLPHRFMCFDLLELEKLEIGPNGIKFAYTQQDIELVADYYATIGWLQGYFTAFNDRTNGDLPKGTYPVQWMTWIFSYCRTNPSGNLSAAAHELIKALLKPN
jgi:hypothetical protein